MAQTAPAKKMLIMNILDILKRYTDPNHKLSQKQIVNILRSDYNMAADRKSVARNLTDLMEAGYPIECTETARPYVTKAGKVETSYILSDFYLERDFTDAELRLLIDSLLFSKHIPYSQCKELVQKLEGLSNQYFKSRVRYIATLPETAPKNRELFYSIEILDEAIEKGRQIAFSYCAYGTDKKLHPKRTADGKVREYVVNPYQMVAANGRYYLICNYDNHDETVHCRLDRITNIRLLDTPVKPVKKVKGLEHGLNLPKHMAEHLYMFGGDSIPVTFRMKKHIMNDVMDWFGTDIALFDETEDEVTARVTVNYHAMRHWALQYCRHVRILAPANLAQTVREDLQDALKKYNG